VVIRSISTSEDHVEYAPIGHTTNLASRMQAIARSGSILTSEYTQRLAEGYFQTKALGPAQIKGLAEPANVFEVVGLGALRTRLQVTARRGLTRFVGREREIDVLKHAAERAKAGQGQLLAAMGEPGVGKSRLFHEFKAIACSGCMVLEALSVSHGKASAFLPLIDLLKDYFEIVPEDEERKRRERVNGKVITLDRSLEDTLPYLFGLLGIVEGDDPLAQMDGQIKRRRTLDAIKRILLRESMKQPLMVIFEDLHWIDEQTQALLNLLADSIGTAKILLLVNYRPDYSHQWGSKTYYTQLRLDPLGKESADEMLLALLGESRDLEPLKRVIIEKTEGNPFFMEETVQVLLDEGALVREGGAVKLTRPVSELKIPIRDYPLSGDFDGERDFRLLNITRFGLKTKGDAGLNKSRTQDDLRDGGCAKPLVHFQRLRLGPIHRKQGGGILEKSRATRCSVSECGTQFELALLLFVPRE
jgi:hypothetical protein